MMDIVATDAYGRKVGRLTVGAQSVNTELVRRGFAWAFTRYRGACWIGGSLSARRAAHNAGCGRTPHRQRRVEWRRAQSSVRPLSV